MKLAPIAVGVIAVAVVAGGVYKFGGMSGGGMTAGPLLALADTAPMATPPGVTYEIAKIGGTVLLATGGIQIPATAVAYADGNGKTLYVSDKDEAGKSNCDAECVKTWVPLAAPATATAFSDWSVVTRADGGKQWALRGRPLYTNVKDKLPLDGNGNGAEEGKWHIALFKAGEEIKTPSGVAVADSTNAAAMILVNEQGSPLYAFDDDKGGKPACTTDPCADHWPAVFAAQIAKPVGDFTVVDRGDGMFQWAYKGHPLYSYTGDVEPGDVNGNGQGGKWHVAVVQRNFMPEHITIGRNNYGASTLLDANGMTLYVRDRVVGTNTGHNLRMGSRGLPVVGKILGTKACDAECTKTWKPLVASADAQAAGYWDVATRDDGTRQWVYRGFAVYSYTGDKKPGDMLGNDTVDIMAGNDPFIMADVGVKGMGAFIWHTATP